MSANLNMFGQVTLLALDNLRANKVRSFLTMLGIVIGVLSVIVIAAIVNGLNTSFENQVANLGTSVVTLTRLPQFVNRQLTAEERTRKEITREEAELVRAEAKHLDKLTAANYMNPFQFPNINLKYKNQTASGTLIIGVEADYLDIYNCTMKSGRFINHADDEHKSRVLVLGATVANNMFPNDDPTGKTMRIENDEFEVIGVMDKRGSFLGVDRDNYAWMPIGTMQKLHSEAHD